MMKRNVCGRLSLVLLNSLLSGLQTCGLWREAPNLYDWGRRAGTRTEREIWAGVVRAVLRYLAVLSLPSFRETVQQQESFWLCCLTVTRLIWTWPSSSKSIQSAGVKAKDEKLVSLPKVSKGILKAPKPFFNSPNSLFGSVLFLLWWLL